jgi:ParB/RepB/Spo0J family partition protein
MSRKRDEKRKTEEPRGGVIADDGKFVGKRSPKDLQPHPRQAEFFGDMRGGAFAELVASIKDESLHQPIEITPGDVVIDGHQRLRAAKELGLEEIEVWVRDDLEDEDAIDRRHIEANATRRQLGRLDQARLIKALYAIERRRTGRPDGAARGDTRDRIARRFGLDGRTAQRWMNVLETPREVQDACSAGKLPMTQAEKVGRLPEAEQELIAGQIRGGRDPQEVVKAFLPRTSRNPTRKAAKVGYLEQLENVLRVLEDRDRELDMPPGDACHSLVVLERVLALAGDLREDLVRYVGHGEARPGDGAGGLGGPGMSAKHESSGA